MKNKISFFSEKNINIIKKIFNIFITFLIIFSVFLVIYEIYYPDFFKKNNIIFLQIEKITIFIFLFEYLIKFIFSQNKLKFPFKIFNIIDLISIIPFFLGIGNTTILRSFRVFRIFKLFKYSKILSIFKYKGTILEKIMPILFIFLFLKSIIWVMESNGFWIKNTDLNELFAIIGFSLGILLSQKIGVSYQKFLDIENILLKMKGTLFSLFTILESKEKGIGKTICKKWLGVFLKNLKENKKEGENMMIENTNLYKVIEKYEEKPADLAVIHGELCRDSSFCFGKNLKPTPKAYDDLLQQSTIFYIFLISIFIPGLTGIISVISSTYILYGMYYLTIDFDTLFGGDYNLINLKTNEIDELYLFLSKK